MPIEAISLGLVQTGGFDGGGSTVSLDPTEGNTNSENASFLNGLTFGSASNPARKAIVEMTLNDSNSDGGIWEDDLGGGETFTIGGTTYALDSVTHHNITITYMDGTTGSGTATVVQATNGEAFLLPLSGDPNAGNDFLDDSGTQGIRSIEFNSVFQSDFDGLNTNREADAFVACYAPGTMIDTPDGHRAVETLRAGDLVLTADHGPQPIRWVRSGDHPLEEAEVEGKPVLIAAGALGKNIPAQDLIVSPQHRILVGGGGQLTGYFDTRAFAPAKALTKLAGIRHMKGKAKITWLHFACDRHEVVTANGCLSESLLLGPMVVNGLTAAERCTLTTIFGPVTGPGTAFNGPAALACLKVGEVRRQIANGAKAVHFAAAKEIRKWDVDAAMERYEAERLRDVASAG